MASRCRGKNNNRQGRLVFFIVAAMVLAQLLSGCGQSMISTGTSATSGINLEPPLLTDGVLQQIAIAGIGETGQLRSAMLEGEGMIKTVDVVIDRSPSCGDGSVEATVATQTVKLMPLLFEYPEISIVTITMLGVTQGVKSDDVAVKVTMDRATASEAEWSMFGPWTMSSMVSDYYIHPQIQDESIGGSDSSAGTYY